MNATAEATDLTVELAAVQLASLDRVLAGIVGRQALTRRELDEVVRYVRALVDDDVSLAALEELQAACEEDLLVSRSKLADALLDIRLDLATLKRRASELSAQGVAR